MKQHKWTKHKPASLIRLICIWLDETDESLINISTGSREYNYFTPETVVGIKSAKKLTGIQNSEPDHMRQGDALPNGLFSSTRRGIELSPSILLENSRHTLPNVQTTLSARLIR